MAGLSEIATALGMDSSHVGFLIQLKEAVLAIMGHRSCSPGDGDQEQQLMADASTQNRAAGSGISQIKLISCHSLS